MTEQIMEINSELQQLGLHKSEIRVYLYLLENGLATPPQVAKGTGIARTNCYHVLRELEEKQLIQVQASGRRKAYLARDPESIVANLERKRETATRIVPELRELYTAQKNKPKIRFFTGLEEVQEIYRQSLSSEKIYGIGSTEHLKSADNKFFDWYVHELSKRKIIFDDLLNSSAQHGSATQMQTALHAIKLLPPRYKDVPTDILIWNDDIALITLERPIFGTIITNSALAQTFKAIFGILWEKL
jgi:sugar-specific transcriptional regulator TrmB